MTDDRLSNGSMLTSWKEIAAFFHRDIRTVQRWEREQALPVHRHQHARKNSVYAYPPELEDWWKQNGQVATANAAADAPTEEAARLGIGWPRLAWTMGATLAAAALGLWGLRSISGQSTGPEVRFPIERVAERDSSGVFVRTLRDINHDGRDDLAEMGPDGVRVYFGRSPRGPREADLHITTTHNANMSVAAVGDVDGDGIGDLVACDEFREPDTYYATAPCYLLRGRREWPAAMEMPRDADTVLAAGISSDIRLESCADYKPADLNGDGLADVLLGGQDYSPPDRRSAGGVFVLFGRPLWPSRTDVIVDADVTIHGSRSGEALHASCGTGDFNGDGRQDLAVRASESTLWNMLGGRGRIYVLAGRDRWPRVIEADQDAMVRIDGTQPVTSITAPRLADVNGDHFDDLVFGRCVGASDRVSGAVFVYFGAPRGVRKSTDEADVIIAGPESVNLFGEGVALHDVNRDGRADLIVADSRNGSVRMLLGRERWSARATLDTHKPIVLLAGVPGVGAFDVALGDYDGDGLVQVAFRTDPSRAGSTGDRWTGVLTPYLPIAVDVRPVPDKPNIVLDTGVVAVGVAAAAGTAFADLDHSSVRLAGQAPTHVSWSDFTNDGVADLQLYFDAASLAISDTTTRLALVGRTKQGLPVAGADDVTVVPVARRPAAAASGLRRP